MIAVDIETIDPNLHELGDGAIRKDGGLLCAGMYDGNTAKVYECNDPELIERLASSEDKVFHNGIYDLSWLLCGCNYKVGGTWHDTMTRTALIDEYAELNLDACCKKFKVAGKNATDTIELWYEQNRKALGLRGTLWNNADVLWMIPEGREQMIKYNIQDCKATYNLFMAQEPYMKNLQEPYQLECELMPLIMEMKKRGFRIDTVALEMLTDLVKNELKNIEEDLQYKYHINREIIASPKKMGLAMHALNIHSSIKTATGNESWSADALDLIDHPAIELIQATKNLSGLCSKYLEGGLAASIVNGRIHATFVPMKRDDGGTITARFACKKPNLQFIPARDEKHGQKSYGQEMRTLFIPEDGCILLAMDYGQIEARGLAHYGYGRQADWFRQQICNGVDYHTAAQEMTGIKNRDVIKRMNFGFIYGMGIKKLISINILLFKKLAAEAGLNIDAYGQQLYNQYHNNFPIIKDTMRHVEQITTQQGYIQSIGGRYHHKPKPYFENGRWNSGIYKMTNYLIQGSCAEILKNALRNAWKAGVFNVLHMHATVHDENVVSVPYSKEGLEAALELEQLMINSYKDRLSVPLTVGVEGGANWGIWDSIAYEKMKNDFKAA